MPFASIPTLSILFLHISLSLSQALSPFGSLDLLPCVRKASSNPKNTWLVENLVADIQNSTLVGVGFNLYRTYFIPCVSDPNGLFDIPCGWINPNFPISCYAGTAETAWTGKTTRKFGKLEGNEWFSCGIYPRGIEGERNIGKEAQQWLKWRVSEFQEDDKKNVDKYDLSTLSPRSIKVQFVNGIPQPATNTSAPGSLVKLFGTTLSLGRNTTQCMLPNDEDTSTYSCEAAPSPSVKCTMLGTTGCQFSVNVTEEVISLSSFKERFT